MSSKMNILELKPRKLEEDNLGNWIPKSLYWPKMCSAALPFTKIMKIPNLYNIVQNIDPWF